MHGLTNIFPTSERHISLPLLKRKELIKLNTQLQIYFSSIPMLKTENYKLKIENY